MSGLGASPDEMPGLPFPRRPAPELAESLLDALLTGQSPPPDAPDKARTIADILASLAGPAGPGELAGEAAAQLAFARAASPAGVLPAACRSRRRRPRWLPAPLSVRLATALVAASAGLGSAAAAYAGVLPGPIQDLAHQMIGAPAARRPPPHPPGGRQAASRLCTAYQRAENHGSPRSLAAFPQLARLAGGAGKIGAYCAAARGPGGGPARYPVGHARPRPGKPARAKAYGHAKGKGKEKAHAKQQAHLKRKAHAERKHSPGRAMPMAKRHGRH